jgi:excisionase family DNA binding protein
VFVKLLTRKQLAEHLGVSTRTVDRWRRAGLLREFRQGGVVRFRPEDVQAFLEGR